VFAGVRKEADKRSVLETCSKVADADTCKRVVPIILDVTKASTIESSLAEIKAWTTEVWLDDLPAHVSDSAAEAAAVCCPRQQRWSLEDWSR
jgi:hypothetical protein